MSKRFDWSQYWKGRWTRGETGWHQSETEPHLVSFFRSLPPTRVFVPLCGKSKDMLWFIHKGHEVIGVELSDLACQSFFEENQIPFEKVTRSGFTVYKGPQISIFNQDIFSIKPTELGKMGGIYDRAALIALPKELRSRYAAHMIKLVKQCSNPSLSYCQIVLERTPSDSNGPPFSVSEQELRDLYGQAFEIIPVSREVEKEDARIRTDECVYKFSYIHGPTRSVTV